MRFAIERASNTYLWELACVYEDWDDEYFLEKTKEKPVYLPDVFKQSIRVNSVTVDIWVTDIDSIVLMMKLIEKTGKSIIIDKTDGVLNRNGIDYLITIYDDYVE
jgi:hypothetical protein